MLKILKFSKRGFYKPGANCLSPSHRLPWAKIKWTVYIYWGLKTVWVMDEYTLFFKGRYITYYKKNLNKLSSPYFMNRQRELEIKVEKYRWLPIYIPYLILLCFLL